MQESDLAAPRSSGAVEIQRYAAVFWVVARAAGLPTATAENLAFLGLVRWAQHPDIHDASAMLHWIRLTAAAHARRMPAHDVQPPVATDTLPGRLAIQFPWLPDEERAVAAAVQIDDLADATASAISALERHYAKAGTERPHRVP